MLGNAAAAAAGMAAAYERRTAEPAADERPLIGASMFGVTTPCVQMVTRQLSEGYDCMVFHATGVRVRDLPIRLESLL